MSNNFVETEPTLQNYWRSVIMFGKNSASYKFALAQALLHLSKRGNDFVTLDELAIPFSESLLRHVKSGNRQSLSASSKKHESQLEDDPGKSAVTTLKLPFSLVVTITSKCPNFSE